MKYVWATLSVLTAVLIFFSSSLEGDVSGEASMALALVIQELFPFAYDVLNFMVRKFAHFLVFAALAFFTANFFKYFLHGRRIYLYAWIFATVYAVFDEIHQYFVPGRVCSVWDVLIDSTGAAVGVLIVYLWQKKRECKTRE